MAGITRFEDMKASYEAEMRAARDADQTAELQRTVEETQPQTAMEALGFGMLTKFSDFAGNLPKNIGIGALRAAVNTVETMDDLAVAGGQEIIDKVNETAATMVGEDGESTAPVVDLEPLPPMQTLFPEAFKHLHGVLDELSANNSVSDEITQGISQFALPFATYMKAFGGVSQTSKLLTATRAAGAEGMAAASAFEAHEGRLADLYQMGRSTDTAFGETLNKLAPDGSLLNRYIDYLTDRTDESAMEGRFKNAIDSMAPTAAIAGFLKSSGVTLRTLKMAATEPGPIAGSIRAQAGHVSFHGSPHKFSQFDVSKMSTGEGNQSFGNGLYFAESEGVANSYRTSADDFLYEVDIPDGTVNKMLDWDKPLSEQPAIMRALGITGEASPLPNRVTPEMSGQELYNALTRGRTTYGVMSKQGASDFLRSKGIPGIRYLDGASRGKGKGTRNLVVFNEESIKQVKRNGEVVYKKGK